VKFIVNLKHILIYIFLVLVVGFGVYGVYHLYVNIGPRNAHFWSVKSTKLDQERIGNLRLYQTIKDLKPYPTPDRNNALFDYYTWEHGMKIATNLNKDKIIRIIIYEENSSPTSKGIRIGDTKEKIAHIYGNDYYERFEQGFDIIGYVDKKLNQTLEFWFSQEKISSIRLDIGSMD
jgi:hypothetical protein